MATKIIINRKSDWRNRNRGFQVLIDGKEMGKITNGSSEEYPVDPGTHTLQCKIAWCSSPELVIAVNDGETRFVSVASAMKLYNIGTIFVLLVILTGFAMNYYKIEAPAYFFALQLLVFLPFLAYLLYYQTLGRKNYLSIGEDKNNIFN